MNLIPWRTLYPFSDPRRRGDLTSLIERFFDDPLRSEHLPEAIQSTSWLPLNISETEKAYTIVAEIPGMDEKDINVQVMGNQLVISGEKKFEEEKKDKEWRRVECQYGSFSRSVTLPRNLKTDAVEAQYKKGVLTLTIPKVEPTPASKIKVRAE